MGRVINVGSDNRGGGEFAPIPHGTKLQATVFAIEEVAVKSGDNAGKPQLVLTFKVQEDFEWTDAKGIKQNARGREIRYQNIPLYDSPGAWKLVTFADAVGWGRDADGNPNVPDTADIASVLGTSLTIKVNEKAPDAQKRVFNEVGGYASAADGVAATNGQSAPEAPSWGGLNRS